MTIIKYRLTVETFSGETYHSDVVEYDTQDEDVKTVKDMAQTLLFEHLPPNFQFMVIKITQHDIDTEDYQVVEYEKVLFLPVSDIKNVVFVDF